MTLVDADGGFALIDAIVALAVLMIVFLPAAMLMMNAATTTGAFRAKMVGESIASGILAQERSAAANPSCLYSQSVLDLNPTAYWPMNDLSTSAPTVANASSQGGSYNATAYNVNATGWDQVPGPVSCDTSNGALAFNGSSTYVSTPVPNPTSDQFSVAGWFKFSGYTGNPRIVANAHTDCGSCGSTGGYTGFQLEVNNNGSGYCPNESGTFTGFFDVGDGSGQGAACWNETISMGQWYFYAGTYNGSTVSAYVDGVPLASFQYGGGAVAAPTCSCSVSLGYNPSYALDFVDGNLADVAIWDSTALTGSQVQALYQAAQGTDSFPPQAPVALPKLWYSQAPFVSTGTWCPQYSASSPAVPCTPVVQKASGITFASYVTGGWCVLSSSGQWGNGTVPASGGIGYFVAVKTAWGGGSILTSPFSVASLSSGQSVVESTQLPIPPNLPVGSAEPAPSWSVVSCPVGLS